MTAPTRDSVIQDAVRKTFPCNFLHDPVHDLLADEIVRLRATLAAVEAERDEHKRERIAHAELMSAVVVEQAQRIADVYAEDAHANEVIADRNAEIEALRQQLAAVEAERAEVKKERGELRQRVQVAEKAARVTVEDCRRQGVSVGRYLANAACDMYVRQNNELRQQLAAAQRVVEVTEDIGGDRLPPFAILNKFGRVVCRAQYESDFDGAFWDRSQPLGAPHRLAHVAIVERAALAPQREGSGE